jgi:hypothetical protein
MGKINENIDKILLFFSKKCVELAGISAQKNKRKPLPYVIIERVYDLRI